MILGGVDITDNFIWSDEFNYNQVEQSQERTLTGGLIIQSGKNFTGVRSHSAPAGCLAQRWMHFLHLKPVPMRGIWNWPMAANSGLSLIARAA